MAETIQSMQAAFAGGATATAVLESSLAAIRTHNARTNAFISVSDQRAHDQAAESDRRIAAGRRLGPLDGIPISIKDLFDIAGEVTTAASRVLDDRIATTTASAVSRLLEAGVVIIGRTNLHEFALGTTSEESAFGPVQHPLDLSRSAGGSSGGSAVAVRMGMGLASLGTDTGGSIRIPAALCGVVGLKPSYGEVPADGVVPLSPSLDHVGPIARSVNDAALVYDVLVGSGNASASVASSPMRLRRLGGYFAAPLDPAVVEAFDRASDRLVRYGLGVEPAEVPSCDAIAETYTTIVLWEAAQWHAPHLDARAHHYTPTTVRTRLEKGRQIPEAAYRQALGTQKSLALGVDRALQDADALLLPTLPILAPPIGTETVSPDPAGPAMPLRTAMLKHTQLFNLSGHPAISIPIPTAGLPIGLQLVGHVGGTRRLLAVAERCERALEGLAS